MSSTSANNTDAQTFKKTTQTVGRPETTDHDLHEDLIKNPPQNVPGTYDDSKDGHQHDIENKGQPVQASKEEIDELVNKRPHTEK